MLRSNQMRRFAPVLLCLVLLLGGLCSGLCLGATTRTHACCHEKSHCGSKTPGMQSHQPLAGAQPVPFIVEQPIAVSLMPLVWSQSLVVTPPSSFIPPLVTSVLRL